MSTLNSAEPIGNLSIEPAFFNSFEMEMMPAQDGDSSSFWGGLEDIVRYDSVRRVSVKKCAISFLDRLLPLDGASHADITRYTVEIPTRYARCFGVLENGRKVPLVEQRKFIGWSGRISERSLLFCNNGLHIEIQTDSEGQAPQGSSAYVRDVTLASATSSEQGCDRRFTAIDGSRMLLPV